MLYSLLRPVLFKFDPETAHRITFNAIEQAFKFGMLKRRFITCHTRHVMDIAFPNPIGLAAGLDKNGEHLDALSNLGFGFIEVGTVTPRPQPGNPAPRIFRIPQAHAIINRLGFNNQGVDQLIRNIKGSNYRGILGINIGKNFDTPIENAVDDYRICLRKVYQFASYITINISSPNTQNLRLLQSSAALDKLLSELKNEQRNLTQTHSKYTPLVVKVAPDLDASQTESIAALLMKHQIDGVIATNTTLSRIGVEHCKHANETGGLSGAPLSKQSTTVIRQLHNFLKDSIPIIGVGGIMSAKDAQEKIDAGACLIQIYTGLIYQGPDLITNIANVLCQNSR